MSSPDAHLRSLVTTTLSENLSPYIRREKLISRLKEIFGQKIEVEVSTRRTSRYNIKAKTKTNILAV